MCRLVVCPRAHRDVADVTRTPFRRIAVCPRFRGTPSLPLKDCRAGDPPMKNGFLADQHKVPFGPTPTCIVEMHEKPKAHHQLVQLPVGRFNLGPPLVDYTGLLHKGWRQLDFWLPMQRFERFFTCFFFMVVFGVSLLLPNRFHTVYVWRFSTRGGPKLNRPTRS